MYDDILGSIEDIRKIKNRRFNIESKREKEEEEDLFEDLSLEMEEIE